MRYSICRVTPALPFLEFDTTCKSYEMPEMLLNKLFSRLQLNYKLKAKCADAITLNSTGYRVSFCILETWRFVQNLVVLHQLPQKVTNKKLKQSTEEFLHAILAVYRHFVHSGG